LTKLGDIFSPKAIDRFIAATTAAAESAPAPVRSPGKRAWAIEEAERALGVCSG
jgi:hypothetical protein